MAKKMPWRQKLLVISIGLVSWLGRFAYRLIAPIVVIGVIYGAYLTISPMPAVSWGQHDVLFMWLVHNWVPFGAILLVWNSVRTQINARYARDRGYLAIGSLDDATELFPARY
jgi:hypothetical protein